jgi:hypothetical protein
MLSKFAAALIPMLAFAHDPVHAPAKPTAAAADIATAKKALDEGQTETRGTGSLFGLCGTILQPSSEPAC